MSDGTDAANAGHGPEPAPADTSVTPPLDSDATTVGEPSGAPDAESSVTAAGETPTSVVPGTGFEPTAVDPAPAASGDGPPASAIPPGVPTAVIPVAGPTAAAPAAVVPAPPLPPVAASSAAPQPQAPQQPYSPQPYQPPGYAQDPYGYAQQPVAYGGYPQAPVAYPPRPMPTTSGNAITALILAIVSWAICPVAAAVVALVFAAKAGKEITNSNGWVTGGGMVLAAKIISWINIVIYGLFTLFFIGMFLFALIIGGMDPGNVYPDPTYTSDLSL